MAKIKIKIKTRKKNRQQEDALNSAQFYTTCAWKGRRENHKASNITAELKDHASSLNIFDSKLHNLVEKQRWQFVLIQIQIGYTERCPPPDKLAMGLKLWH